MRRYDDGQMDLLALGQRPLSNLGINEDRSYLRAEVEFFEDVDLTEVPSDLRCGQPIAHRRLLALEGREADAGSSTRLSFQIAYLLDDVDKRQMILALRSEVERLEFLVKAVPDYVLQQERITPGQASGAADGHAKKLGTGDDH